MLIARTNTIGLLLCPLMSFTGCETPCVTGYLGIGLCGAALRMVAFAMRITKLQVRHRQPQFGSGSMLPEGLPSNHWIPRCRIPVGDVGFNGRNVPRAAALSQTVVELVPALRRLIVVTAMRPSSETTLLLNF